MNLTISAVDIRFDAPLFREVVELLSRNFALVIAGECVRQLVYYCKMVGINSVALERQIFAPIWERIHPRG